MNIKCKCLLKVNNNLRGRFRLIFSFFNLVQGIWENRIQQRIVPPPPLLPDIENESLFTCRAKAVICSGLLSNNNDISNASVINKWAHYIYIYLYIRSCLQIHVSHPLFSFSLPFSFLSSIFFSAKCYRRLLLNHMFDINQWKRRINLFFFIINSLGSTYSFGYCRTKAFDWCLLLKAVVSNWFSPLVNQKMEVN